MTEFVKKLTNAEELLRIEEGETQEQAIARWWQENGLDVDKGRKARKEEYIRQLKQAAVTMAKWKEGK